MDYSEEIVNAAHEVAERTGVSAELLKCTAPENMEALASVVIQHKGSQTPKVHAAPHGSGSRIIRDDGPRRSSGEIFADYIKDRMNWA